MDLGSQNLSFGDFSNLSVEEHQKVFSILHSSRNSADRKVEFPWDNASFDQPDKQVPSSDPTQSMGRQPCAPETPLTQQDVSKAKPDLLTSEPNRIIDNLRGQPIQFLDNCPDFSNQSVCFDVSSSQAGQTGFLNERSDTSSSGSGQGSSDQSREVTPTDGKEADYEEGRGSGRLLASMKTYERRNKKKRPPGYYEKIAQEEVPLVHGMERMTHPKDASPIYMFVPENTPYSLDKPPPNHPIIPSLSSHSQPVITASMVIPGANYGPIPAGALPMYPSPQGYPMQTFQPGMAFSMHPSGLPILPAHLQQQYGMIPMPPQPHIPPPGSQQHIVTMADVAVNYQRSPIDPRPIISQDIRQYPPGFSPADLSMQRRYVPAHQTVPEGHYRIRRTSYTERLPPDGREMTNHRFSEPPPSGRAKKQFSPPQKDEGHVIEHSKNIDVNKIDTDLKTAPSIADKGQNSSHGSGETTFIRTKDADKVMSNVNVSQSNNEQVDPEVVLVQPSDIKPIIDPPNEVQDVELSVEPVIESVIESVQKTDQPENDGKDVATDSKSNVNIKIVEEVVSSENIDTVKFTDTTVTVTETPVPVIASPPAPKASSWAGLFKGASPKPTTVPSPIVTTGAINNSSEAGLSPPAQAPQISIGVELKGPVPASEDSAAKQLGELLYSYKMSFEARPLQPRGLTNHSNWCYVNATLQALVACPAFYNLLKQLPNFPALTRGPSSTPILDSLVEFVYEFSPAQLKPVEKIEKGKKRVTFPELIPGLTFEPSYVYKMLQVIESSSSFKGGKQEDAEEFLSCVLNGLHEEMAAAMKEVAHKQDPLPKENEPESEVVNGFHDDDKNVEEDNQWEQVGPKNRSVFTRKAHFAKTPVSDLFAGQIRSAVFQAGSRESAMLEPFFTLQLDIQSDKVYTVKEALEGLVSKESVQGFTCSKTKAQIEVTRRLTLEELPPVLILHLKFFIYDKSGGCQKLLKKIDYSTDLEINRDLLSPNVRSKLPTNQRMYKLFAVVYHHGKTVTGGHYTTDVYHPGINSWIQMDDSHIKPVHLQQVLKFVSPRVPYLLYYRRMDLV